MWSKNKDKWVYADNLITLYLRGSKWNARYKFPAATGGYERRSLKTSVLEEAKEKALKEYGVSLTEQPNVELSYRTYVKFDSEHTIEFREQYLKSNEYLNFKGFWSDEDDGLKRIYLPKRNALIFRRDYKPDGYLQGRIRRPDKKGYKFFSFKTHDWTTALRSAAVHYRRIREKFNNDVPLDNHRFEFVWNKWMDRTGSLRSEQRNDHFERMANLYFFKFFNKLNFAQIDEDDLANYFEWREVYWTKGPGSEDVHPSAALSPKASSLAQERDALNQLFKWAVRQKQKFIARRPEIQLPKSIEPNPRPALPHEMFSSYAQKAIEYIYGSDRHYDQWHRACSAYFTIFMLFSGLRPKEAKLVKWQDLKLFYDNDGVQQLLIVVHPETKTKGRETVPLTQTIALLKEWRSDWARHKAPNDYVFGNWEGEYFVAHGRGISKLLKSLGIYRDTQTNRPRSAYSFRHTYATHRLLNGVDVYKLAKNMGTSVEMIEKHYGKVTNQMNAIELTQMRHKDNMLIPNYNTVIEGASLAFKE